MICEATISTGTLLTAYTGIGYCESFLWLSDVFMGQSLMSSNFAPWRVWDEMRREALRQHPWLADVDLDAAPDVTGLSHEQASVLIAGWVKTVSDVYGERHVITSPPETRRVPLFEGLPAKFGGVS